MPDPDWPHQNVCRLNREPISFAGKTTYGLELESSLPWTPEARERLERVPSFVRGMLAKPQRWIGGDHDSGRRNSRLSQLTKKLKSV